MACLVNCLPCKHEDLSFGPRHPFKSGTVVCTRTPSVWEAETRGFLGLAGQLLEPVDMLHIQ